MSEAHICNRECAKIPIRQHIEQFGYEYMPPPTGKDNYVKPTEEDGDIWGDERTA